MNTHAPIDTEAQLDAFEPTLRREALNRLMAKGPEHADTGHNINMHIHSFFSYNAENWSPSHIAWACRQRGLYAAGLIDFDVLDGMEEFLDAGERLGLRVNVGLETRVYYPEFADKEIDSPGEPGVHYIDGIGFYRLPPEGSKEADTLAAYRRNAQARNVALVNRINPHVPDIAIDYDRDVVTLVPAGAPTERHIIAAYVNKAEQFTTGRPLALYWACLLGVDPEIVEQWIADRPTLEEKVRARFAKRGGFGYEQPSDHTFPPMDEFCAWVRACGAIPMESWLDGTSDGERNAEQLLETSIGKGCEAFNIIPDRNWNIRDPDEKAIKVSNLRRVVDLCEQHHLPINIGTEMNKRGLPFVDDLDGPVLSGFRESFIRGARVLVGHTICGRFAEAGYVSDAAIREFPDRQDRNIFFAAVGALNPVTCRIADRLRDAGPSRAYSMLRDSAARGAWMIEP